MKGVHDSNSGLSLKSIEDLKFITFLKND